VADEHPSEIVVLHYHFRPGGVRTVIELLLPRLSGHFGKITLLGGEPPDPAWADALLREVPSARFAIHPALGYLDGSGVAAPGGVRADIRRVLRSEVAPGALLWAHNLSLGRNILLADEVAAWSAATGGRLLSHHHDFWCDWRWARWPEMRALGFDSLERVAGAVFASGARVVHAGINSRDARLLAGHLPGTAWLPNPADTAAAPPAEKDVRRAGIWLASKLGARAPVWVYPARFLPRKNIPEAVLLARCLCPGGWLVTTGGAGSGREDRLVAAARSGGWRARFGLLADAEGPPVRALMAAADSLVMTSVQEGFGFPYLEGAVLGKRLLARRLPRIQPDLDALGVTVPGLYDEVAVPCGLIDAEAEAARRRTIWREWHVGLPDPVRPMAVPPEFPDARPIPFSRHSPEGQLEILALPPDVVREACLGANPVLAGIESRPPPTLADPEALSPSTCARRILRLGFAEPAPTAAQAAAAQTAIIRDRMSHECYFPVLAGG
jgi:glycosyltransferase involved in cell wall biosynthesis